MTDSLYVKTASGILPIAIEGTGGGGSSTTIEAETHTITETSTSAQSYSIGNCAYVMVFVNSVLGVDGVTYGITGGTTLQFTDVLPVGSEVVIVKFKTAGSVTPTPTYAIDSALSATSTNAVQNKVVKAAIDAKADEAQVNEILSPLNTKVTNLQASIDSAYAKYVAEIG
nr:MAG TPA: hypothetical protein [Caudoviricetes sp.]